MSNFVRSLGDDNIPTTFLIIGAVMLAWIFFVGDMVLPPLG